MTPEQAKGLALDLNWSLSVLDDIGTTKTLSLTQFQNMVTDVKAVIAALETVSGTTSSSGTSSTSSSGSAPPPIVSSSYVNPGIWCADTTVKVLLENDSSNGPRLALSSSVAALWPSKNGIWDGSTATLKSARNMVASFQLFLSPSSKLGWHGLSVSMSLPGLRPNLFLEWAVSVLNLSSPSFSAIPMIGSYPDALIPLSASFDVAYGQTRGIWIDIPIPSSFSPGTLSGTLTVQQGNVVLKTIPISLAIGQAVLPDLADVPFKTWIPLYSTRLASGEGLPKGSAASVSPEFVSLAQNYQKFLRSYGFDSQADQIVPSMTLNAATDTWSINWNGWTALNKPALDGTLFPDGKPLRVINSPISEEWNGSGAFGWSYTQNTLPPSPMIAALKNYASQISALFQQNNWSAEILGYIWDEPEGKIGTASNLKAIIEAYAQAMEGSGVRFFCTVYPSWDPNLSALGTVFAPGSALYMPNEMDPLTEKWTYQNHEPFIGNTNLNSEAIGMRTWAWIALKYGLSGLFYWCANWWGTPSVDSTPTDPTTSPYLNSLNYGSADQPGNAVLVYPGAQLPLIGFSTQSGPVASMRLAQFREGLQDILLFGMASVQPANPIINALDWTNDVNYWNNPDWTKPGDWTHNPDDWTALRNALLEAVG